MRTAERHSTSQPAKAAFSAVTVACVCSDGQGWTTAGRAPNRGSLCTGSESPPASKHDRDPSTQGSLLAAGSARGQRRTHGRTRERSRCSDDVPAHGAHGRVHQHTCRLVRAHVMQTSCRPAPCGGDRVARQAQVPSATGRASWQQARRSSCLLRRTQHLRAADCSRLQLWCPTCAFSSRMHAAVHPCAQREGGVGKRSRLTSTSPAALPRASRCSG